MSMEAQLTTSQKAPLHKICAGAAQMDPPHELATLLTAAAAALVPKWDPPVVERANEIFGRLYACVLLFFAFAPYIWHASPTHRVPHACDR